MSKAKKYSINGALILGSLNAIRNAIKQHYKIKENTRLEFSWRKFLVAAGKGALGGGAGGFALGAYVDYKNSQVKPINTDTHLMNLADKIKLDKNDPTYISLSQKAELFMNMLKNKYGSSIQATPRLGSTQSDTALKAKFDIDFGVNFSSNTFNSIEEMFLSVLDFFEKQVGRYSITKVRDQKKSIGVFVKMEGKEHKIDVVPCKLTKGARGSGYLYVNDTSFIGNSPSYTKTNIKALNSIKLSSTQQRIVVVLKKWKTKNDLPISSHLLLNLILDAYAYAPRTPRTFTAELMMVIKHIANNLDVAVIRGIENTNNIITDIPRADKGLVIRICKEAVEDYEYQPNSVLETFGILG